MKKAISLLLSAAVLFALLPACGDAPERETDLVSQTVQTSQAPEASLLEMVKYIWDAVRGGQEDAVETFTLADPESLALYMEKAYGLDAEQWEDSAVIRMTGASAFELAVIRFTGEEEAKNGAERLKDYLRTREGDFDGYAPDQARMVANAAVEQSGAYAGLFICDGPEEAKAAFEAVLSGEPLPDWQQDQQAVPYRTDDVNELLELMLEQCAAGAAGPEELERLDGSDPDALRAYIETAYGLSERKWTQAAIARSTNGSAFELAVIRLADPNEAIELLLLFNDYLNAREAAFSGDAPDEADDALAMFAGGYIVLLVCQDPHGVEDAFACAVGADYIQSIQRHFEETAQPSAAPGYPGRTAYTDPHTDDMSIYDTSAILAAWDKGDPSGLSEYDRDIYDAAQAVLGEILRDGMSGGEKEAAVYRWLVNSVDYDWTHQDVMTETPRGSYTPYGGLVNRTAVCLGYAVSFQLLMDLAGVECITVVGAAFQSRENHAWNMVRLDGEWYCVDATWDANYREQGISNGIDWTYFNVTSDFMAISHQWDYANTPEAVTVWDGQG